MTLIWTGGDRLQALLEHALHEGAQAGAHALQDAAERIIPTESSELRESGKVTADGDRAAVSFSTPYAVIDHQSGYPRHRPPQTRHWLTRPMLENGEEVLAAIGGTIDRELGL
jgi:hypothetical protein